MLFLLSADICHNSLFQKIISGTLSVSNGLEKIGTDVFSVMTWVQTACKGYQQTNNSSPKQGELKT